MTLVKGILLVVAGFLVILAGIAMLVLPGPGWATIFLGLYLWSKVFRWADRLLVWAKREARTLIRGKRKH